MANMMRRASDRTLANSLGASSVEQGSLLDGIRAGSSLARMAPNLVPASTDVRSIVRDLINERDSQKTFALQARCAESDLSNALKGKQRLDAQWLIDQDDAFVDELLRRLRTARGLSAERQDEIDDQQVLQLIAVLLRRRRSA